jgi:hypothetical protein
MNEKAAVEQRLRRVVRPDSDDVPEHLVHRPQRDQADGVVEQMHCHIGEHQQAGRKPKLPDHRNAGEMQSRIAKALVTGA